MKMYNIWDLERVHIRLNTIFLDKINKEIFNNFRNKNAFYNNIFKNREIPFTTFKNILKPSNMKNFFVPLEIYLKITDFLKISKEELQQNIIAYKTGNGVNKIKEPMLPIIINPVFHMLTAHHMGDGTVINPKRGRLPYFGYRQFDEFYRLSFLKKSEFVFGKINYGKNYVNKSTRVYLPPVLSTLFFKHYNLDIKGFLSERIRMPNTILTDGKDSMLAFLLGFVIDEGNVDSTQITITLKNKLMIEDLKKICDILSYKSKVTLRKGDYKYYACLHILREGMKKLFYDYLSLNKKYSIINLGKKGDKIKKSFKIYERKIKKIKGNQELILSIIKKENLSVNQIADRINMTRQGVRFHVRNLLKNGKIRLIDNIQLNWLYGV